MEANLSSPDHAKYQLSSLVLITRSVTGRTVLRGSMPVTFSDHSGSYSSRQHPAHDFDGYCGRPGFDYGPAYDFGPCCGRPGFDCGPAHDFGPCCGRPGLDYDLVRKRKSRLSAKLKSQGTPAATSLLALVTKK